MFVLTHDSIRIDTTTYQIFPTPSHAKKPSSLRGANFAVEKRVEISPVTGPLWWRGSTEWLLGSLVARRKPFGHVPNNRVNLDIALKYFMKSKSNTVWANDIQLTSNIQNVKHALEL